MSIVITSPTGHIGTRVVEKLLAAGGDVTLGDGSGDAGGGVINLVAGGNALVNVGGSAKVGSVTAGGSAILRPAA